MMDYTGITNFVAEPLTVHGLQEVWRTVMMSMPKGETFLSTRCYIGDGACRIEGAEENFTVAHPLFWARVEQQTERRYSVAKPPLGSTLPFAGIQIIEIDPCPADSADAAARRAAYWTRLAAAAGEMQSSAELRALLAQVGRHPEGEDLQGLRERSE
jgi:hypothetical protein